MENIGDLKTVFAGCARDCEKYLPVVLENIEHYSKIFKETSKIIVENGSTDKTKEILKNIENEKNIVFFRDDLNEFKQKTIRLALVRNMIIDEIKKNKIFKNFDLLIILDLDDRGQFKIEKENFIKALNFLYSKDKIAAVFANQPGDYFDLWALRDDLYNKSDFWCEALKYTLSKINSDECITFEILNDLKRNFLNKKKLSFDLNSSPYKVKSAFGGFGIYKINKIFKNKLRYIGEQEFNVRFRDGIEKRVHYQKCEHVNFNLGFEELGLDLYILPYLTNSKKKIENMRPEAAFQFILNKKEILNLSKKS
tara:strand:- start:1380 stop:2309 length:930 start_codon:yes stop_codon:yes gene_type:complete